MAAPLGAVIYLAHQRIPAVGKQCGKAGFPAGLGVQRHIFAVTPNLLPKLSAMGFVCFVPDLEQDIAHRAEIAALCRAFQLRHLLPHRFQHLAAVLHTIQLAQVKRHVLDAVFPLKIIVIPVCDAGDRPGCAGVPVWNGLTNEFHPTQILADFLTIREHFGRLKGIHFVYFGDARYNMGNSLMVGCAKMGLNFTACAPKKYQPDPALVAQCQAIAAETGAALSFEEDPAKAARGADVLYTDVWVSMGEPVEVWAERINDLAPYQINQQLMDLAGPKAVFMHCLPAFHDHKTTVGKEMGERFGRDAMEVTDEVFEGPQSIVFDEAENRMHTIKAVMAATLGYEK